jgi:hypothetical protein
MSWDDDNAVQMCSRLQQPNSKTDAAALPEVCTAGAVFRHSQPSEERLRQSMTDFGLWL